MSNKKLKATATILQEEQQAITKANNIGNEKLSRAQTFPIWMVFVIAFLLSITVYIAYQPALDNDFVDWDDYTYVVDNPMIRNENIPTSLVFKKPVSLNYHPLTMWSMKINNNTCATCSAGISAKPFIMGNILLHMANTLLVFYLMLKFTPRHLYISAVAAFLFAVHPMHVESVAWVSERKDVLYTFFFLAAMATYWAYLQRDKKIWLMVTFMLFILSCLSKAMAVVFPVVMLLMDYWYNRAQAYSWKSIVKFNKILTYSIFLLISLLFGIMAIKIQAGGNFLGLLEVSAYADAAINSFNTFDLMQRFNFAAYGFMSYIISFFYPHNLSTYYEYPTLEQYSNNMFFWYANLLAMISLIGLAIYYFFKGEKLWQKSYVVGMGFYFITVCLVLQFLSVGAVIKADRYTYLPYIGLAFLLLMPLSLLQKKYTNIVLALYMVLGIAFLFQTQKEVDVWQNSDTLWQRVIDTQEHQGKQYAYAIRGTYMGKQAERAMSNNNAQQAQLLLNEAYANFEQAKALGSQKPEVYEGLANIYSMRQNYALAIENYNIAIEIAPNRANSYFNLGVTYDLLKDWKKAVEAYDKVEQLDFQLIDRLYAVRSAAALQIGMYDKAIKDLEWLTKNIPNQYTHWANLGVAKMMIGDKNAAKFAFEKALSIKPNDAFVLERYNSL